MAKDSSVAVDLQSQYDHRNSFGDSSIGEMAAEDSNSVLNRLLSDPTSPYYLYYGDNTGIQIISVALTEDNYLTWSRAVIVAFSVKNKECFIDGTIEKPRNDDPLFSA
ncbi:unnamed protein product [Fraxinus pennsylvanica]|uniref:Retrotransposon Copia-like N-terminal domain-containing protein n=1 Tax=Fraxinus pennsylvanica TaxID=56036 RepID=A0AAD2EDA7_9LAMI|nr:unnamed protein product [Fraxinus pennsylvanica]